MLISVDSAPEITSKFDKKRQNSQDQNLPIITEIEHDIKQNVLIDTFRLINCGEEAKSQPQPLPQTQTHQTEPETSPASSLQARESGKGQ